MERHLEVVDNLPGVLLLLAVIPHEKPVSVVRDAGVSPATTAICEK